MGYTHYWYRPEVMNEKKFKGFAEDCKKIVQYCKNQLGISIVNGSGEAGTNYKIDGEGVWFNGGEDQEVGVWTTSEHISIPWPSNTASLSEVQESAVAEKRAGTWFAGDMIEQRVAPIDNLTGKGSGSYETFAIDRVEMKQEWKKEDKMKFACCKTAYRPYDLTVTACLIAFKHWFPRCKVSSDGEEKDWLDGRFLCNNLLGYGMTEKIGGDD